jgi:hypothetical protein
MRPWPNHALQRTRLRVLRTPLPSLLIAASKWYNNLKAIR